MVREASIIFRILDDDKNDEILIDEFINGTMSFACNSELRKAAPQFLIGCLNSTLLRTPRRCKETERTCHKTGDDNPDVRQHQACSVTILQCLSSRDP